MDDVNQQVPAQPQTPPAFISFPPSPSPLNPPGQNSLLGSKTNWLKWALVIIFVSLLSSGGTYFVLNQREQNPQPTPIIQIPSPSPTPDPTANWKTYQDTWVTFKYPSNLYAKSGAQFGNEHVVTLVSNQDTDYRNGEFTIDSSLRGNLADYDMAVKTYKAITNPQINSINGGVVISGTISNQMVSNLNVKYALLKYKSGAILIKDEKITPIADDQTFDQILSTFKFTQ